MNQALPQALDAERATLACALTYADVATDVMNSLSEEDFFNGMHRNIFQAIVSSYPRIDVPIVIEYLRRNRLLDDDTASYVLELGTGFSGTITSAGSYIESVRDASTRRKILSSVQRIQRTAVEGASANDAMGVLQNEFLGLSKKVGKSEWLSATDAATKTEQEIHTARTSPNPPGIRTGFTMLDKMVGKLKGGDYVVLAARPSMGKTALLLAILNNAVRTENPKNAGVFSLEMQATQLMRRLAVLDPSDGALTMTQINKDEYMSDSEFVRMQASMRRIATLPVHIDDTPALTLSELSARAYALASRTKLDVLFVDYLQLMQGDSAYGANNNLKMQAISNGLKNLAKQLDVPIIILSQLSRGVESRPDKKPMLSDLRDTGAIEQDADLVIFLYREGYYNANAEDPYKTTLIVAKQRNGPTGEVDVRFVPHLATFVDLPLY